MVLKSRTGESSVAKNDKDNADKTPGDDERMNTAMKAAQRILAPFQGKIPKELWNQLQTGVADDGEPQPGEVMAGKTASATQSPEPVKEEHKIEAMKAAKGAYKEALKKLGYPKYPTKQIEQKADKDMDEDCEKAADDMDEDDEDKAPAKKAKKVEKTANFKQEGSMPNDEKESVMKALLSNVPDETRPAVEAIFKANQELVKKTEDLTKQLADSQREVKRKEFVAKAEGFTNLGLDTKLIADTFLALSETAPAQLEAVEKALTAANEQAGKGQLFAEFGSNLPSGGTNTWEKFEKAAEGYVAKSGEKVTKAEAIDKFMTTNEGKRMYDEYMKDHASNKR